MPPPAEESALLPELPPEPDDEVPPVFSDELLPLEPVPPVMLPELPELPEVPEPLAMELPALELPRVLLPQLLPLVPVREEPVAISLREAPSPRVLPPLRFAGGTAAVLPDAEPRLEEEEELPPDELPPATEELPPAPEELPPAPVMPLEEPLLPPVPPRFSEEEDEVPPLEPEKRAALKTSTSWPSIWVWALEPRLEPEEDPREEGVPMLPLVVPVLPVVLLDPAEDPVRLELLSVVPWAPELPPMLPLEAAPPDCAMRALPLRATAALNIHAVR